MVSATGRKYWLIRCKECALRCAAGAHGLCKKCKIVPALRQKYGLKDDVGQMTRQPPRPTRMPVPTQAVPGSPEKVKVLADRLWAGERLWHPDDLDGSQIDERRMCALIAKVLNLE